MERYKYLLKFFIANWKMLIHLIFRTKRFGVNNQWWGSFDSLWGWNNSKKVIAIIRVKPLIQNYKGMIFRSAIGFIPWDDFTKIVSDHQFRKMFPSREKTF